MHITLTLFFLPKINKFEKKNQNFFPHFKLNIFLLVRFEHQSRSFRNIEKSRKKKNEVYAFIAVNKLKKSVSVLCYI